GCTAHVAAAIHRNGCRRSSFYYIVIRVAEHDWRSSRRRGHLNIPDPNRPQQVVRVVSYRGRRIADRHDDGMIAEAECLSVEIEGSACHLRLAIKGPGHTENMSQRRRR